MLPRRSPRLHLQTHASEAVDGVTRRRSTRLHPQIHTSDDDGDVVTRRRSPRLRPQVHASDEGDGVARRRSARLRPQVHAGQHQLLRRHHDPRHRRRRTTTISSLGQDELLEIFLRLPNLPALVRAALTCRSWLAAVRSSRPFRRLFRALHPAPLIGIFLKVDDGTGPSFAPLRRSDPDVTAALRRGDFFLTSLPPDDCAPKCWTVKDCRDGYILMWDIFWTVVAVNPMTWAADIIPLPGDIAVGRLGRLTFLGFHLLSSEENPGSFVVVCVCADRSRVRAAVFSSGTRYWVVHPWVEIGGEYGLKYGAGTLVDGSVYCPFYEGRRVIRINIATMDVTSLDLPSRVIDYGQADFIIGDTKDGELCMLYASDDFHLHVWIRSVDGDGIGIWVPQPILSLSTKIELMTGGSEGKLRVVQARSGCVYLYMTFITRAGRQQGFLFYNSLGTTEIELLIHGTFHDSAYPYIMAWPPCLIGDDGGTGHEVEGSH